jgi:hypothetical protein
MTCEDTHMQDFFFQIPWWAPASLIAAGIGIWVWGNNRLRIREKRIGLALVLLAVLLSAISYFVDTPSETVDRLTRQFVSAVVARDTARTGELLHPDAIAFNWDRQDIINGAQYYAEKTGLTGARVTGLQVAKDGPDLVSYLNVWSDHAGGPELPATNLTSQWKLVWAGQGKSWRLIEIVPLQIGTVQGDQVQHTYLERPVKPRR